MVVAVGAGHVWMRMRVVMMSVAVVRMLTVSVLMRCMAFHVRWCRMLFHVPLFWRWPALGWAGTRNSSKYHYCY